MIYIALHSVCVQVVVEPSGAAGLAAAMSPQFSAAREYSRCQRVGVILCGGNIDLTAKGFWKLWKADERGTGI